MASESTGVAEVELNPERVDHKREVRVPGPLSKRAKDRILKTMEEVQTLGFLADFDWARLNLVRSLSRMERGETKDFRGKTPYYEVPRERVVAAWQPVMQKQVYKHLGHSNYSKELILLEHEQAQNISVQSRYAPFSVDGVDKLKAYFNRKSRLPLNSQAWEATLNWAVSLVPHNSLHSLSADEVWTNTTTEKVDPSSDAMDSNTHSGAIHFQHGWKVSAGMDANTSYRVREVENWLRPAAEEYYNRIDEGEAIPNVSIIFQRLAQKADPSKIKRLVWAVWKPAVLAEKRFIPAIQDVFRKIVLPGGVPVGVGLTDPLNSDLACQLMLEVAEREKRVVLGLDYSAFDATQSVWLNEQVYQVWSHWFHNGDWLVKFAKQMFSNHYVIAPTGVYHPDAIGGPSGLTDTLIRNSFISLLVMRYGFEARYWDEPRNAMFLGDDGNVDAAGLTAEKYRDCAAEFGLVVNADKSFYKPGMVHWLQRLHFRGLLGGAMPTNRMLGSIMSHERSVDIGRRGILEVIRTYGSVENCAEHPAFEAFVEFVAKGDARSLGRDLSERELAEATGVVEAEGRSLAWKRKKAVQLAGQSDEAELLSSYDDMAVRGVLKGESLPPIGSYARFLRVYGQERINTNVHPALAHTLAKFQGTR